MDYGLPVANETDYAIHKLHKAVKKVQMEREIAWIIAEIEHIWAMRWVKGDNHLIEGVD